MSVQIESSVENNEKLCGWRSKDIDGDARVICIVLSEGELFLPLVYKGGNRKKLFLLGGKREEFFNTVNGEKRRETSEEIAIREAFEEGGVHLVKDDLYFASRRQLSPNENPNSCPYQDFFITIIYDNFEEKFTEPTEGIDKVLVLRLDDVMRGRTGLQEVHLKELIMSLGHIMREVTEIGTNSRSPVIINLSNKMMEDEDLFYLFMNLEKAVKNLLLKNFAV